MDVTVKFGRDTLSLSLAAESTVEDLQKALETETGLMLRKQKLMVAGRVISGKGSSSLAAAGVKPGAKLMLLAAAAAPSQGQAALEASRLSKQEALERGRQQLAERAAEKGITAGGAGGGASSAPSSASMAQRADTWAKLGIVALRDLKLTQLPQELFSGEVPAAGRVLDAGGNMLSSLPPSFAALTGLRRLRLSLNQLTNDGMAWPVLCTLSQLAILAVDDNRLTVLPDCISGLHQLQKLSLNGNQIVSLPDSIASLQQLRALALRGNRLAAVPPVLGSCVQLQELDLRDNLLEAVPQQLSQLARLKLLLLDNNRVKTVPSDILTACSGLVSLSLHGNPVTIEELREMPGWKEYDERRRGKYDKQVDMKVLSGGFDEGAGLQDWEHWNS